MRSKHATSRRSIPKTPVAIAVALLAATLLWWMVAVPALVKYPTDLNVTPRYAGTFTLYVDPATSAPLATPLALPLTVERHIQVIGDQSGSSRVVVQETIKQDAGDLVHATQTNVYVMDRSTMKNVSDPRAYAFTPSNIVDRSGAYRLNLPFDTSTSGTYSIYKNEIGGTYQMKGDPQAPTTKEAGLTLHTFTASLTDAPIDAAYLAELNKLVPLPTALTIDQLKPQLKAAGIDVDAVLAALQPVITPTDLVTLAGLAAKPIPLQYVLSFNGKAAVETSTGGEVNVGAIESVGAKPVLADAVALQDVLAHYPSVPEAVSAVQALNALSTQPAIKLFEYNYQQTPASVADIGKTVSSMRSDLTLAKVYVPFGLLAGALLSSLVAGWMWWRRGRPHPTAVGTPPPLETLPAPHETVPAPRERETIGAGSR